MSLTFILNTSTGDYITKNNSRSAFLISDILSIGEIGQLSDVDLTGTSPALASDHFMVYNGTSWIHKQPSDAIISLGITATAAELNYLDITTLGTSEASKAVTVDANGNLIIPDSDKFQFGAGLDMTLYHDGTDSYLTNQTGTLKIATETAGVPITIGHATSEVTIGDNLSVTGNLTVNGTTTTINSTVTTLDDPIITLGGDAAPSSDDNKDRGVEFRWHDGSNAKVGFFGYDDSTSKFTFIPDATNTSEVFAGSAGNVSFGTGDFTGNLVVDTSTLVADASNNRVGIGTATPATTLHIVDTVADAEIVRIQGSDGTASLQGGNKIKFSRDAMNYISASSVSGGLRLETGGEGNPRLTIDNTGISTFTNNVVLDNAKSLVMSELDSNGSNTVSVKAPDSVASDVVLTLPVTTGNLVSTGDSTVITNTMLSGSIADSKLSTISTADKVSLSALNLDGATDIGADLVDADLIAVDDGAAGTNRKSALSRIKKYVYSAISGDAAASDAGVLTIANDSIETSMVNKNVVTGQTAKTSIHDNDIILLSDSEDSNNLKKMTKANFVSGLSGSSTLASLSDTAIASPIAGHILVHDGVDSFDNIAMSGDATIASNGAITLHKNAIGAKSSLSALSNSDEFLVHDTNTQSLTRFGASALLSYMQNNLTFTSALTQENVEDYVGGMVAGNTETFIAVTYDDSDGTLDFVVPVLDEDNMASDSAVNLATQQSIKAYVDAQTASPSVKANDLTLGDAAVLLTTSAGNITIDAQGNDTDIILKGTDGSSDTTFLTLDGSEAGAATFNASITAGGNILPSAADTYDLGSTTAEWQHLYLGDGGSVKFGVDQDVNFVHNPDTGLTIQMSGTGSYDPRFKLQRLGGGTIGPELFFSWDRMGSASSDGDRLGSINFDAGAATVSGLDYVNIEAYVDSVSNNTGRLDFKTLSNNTSLTVLSMEGTTSSTVGSVTINAGASSLTTVAGDLQISGNDIKDSGGNTAITFNGSGAISKLGDDTPSDGQVLTWDNSNSKVVWSAAGASALNTLSDVDISSASTGQILVHDGTDSFDNVSMSGDVTINAAGATTIAANAVEGSMLNSNTISGQTEMTGDLADTDELMVSDAGTLKRADFSVVRDAVFTDVSGDATIAAGGALTIAAGAVDYAMIASAAIKDEDNMASDSDAHLATQQSIKAYVTSQVSGAGLDIDGYNALGSASLHQTQDHFVVSDNGTEKKVAFSNLEDTIFSNISGDATVAAGGALTIAATSVEGSMLNTNVISGQTAMTGDVADTDELLVSDAGTIKRADFSVVRDAIFNDISGDATVAAGGALTIAANSVTLGTDTTGDYVSSLSAGAGLAAFSGGEGVAETVAVDGVLEDLDTLGAPSSDGQFIVATGAGAFAYETGATVRTSLGLAIGTNVQAFDAQLADVAGLTPGDGSFIVGDGSNFVAESGATVRTSLGLGTGSSPTFTSLSLSGQAGVLDINNQKLTSLATPTAASDAANKSYVDSVAAGLDIYDSVKASTTASFTMASTASTTTLVLADGEGGFNATANTLTIDGISLAQDSRILVKDGVNSNSAGVDNKWNGIYTVGDLTASSLTLTRSTDMDLAAEFNSGAFFFVEQGTVNADAGFVLTTDATVTVGTTAITFTQFSGAGDITAGSALTKSGNTLNVGVDDSSIEVSSDALRVKAAGITNAMLAGSIADSKLSAISTANKVNVSAIDLDGATDIGADLVDADLIVVDDGAGGTNRKSTLTRIKKFVYSAMSGDATASDAGALTIAANAVEGSMLNTDAISGQTAMTGDVADTDELMISDAGTLKRADFSVVRDAIFNDISGDATVAAGGALTIAAGAVENSMLADDAVGADELAADAVVNASIAAGAAIDVDKIDWTSEGGTLTDFAQDDKVFLYDTDGTAIKSMTLSNLEDSIFGNVSGDAAVAAGGALTIAAGAVEGSMLDANVITGQTAETSIANDDVVLIYDTSATALRKMTKANFVSGLGGGSVAADDITTGDAAVTLATSTGNITIDAQGSDTDIILKGTDGSSDTTFLTLDGSDGGTAIFNHDIKLQSDSARLYFGADDDVYLQHDADDGLMFKVPSSSSYDPIFHLVSDSAGTIGPMVKFTMSSSSPAVNDKLGIIEWRGKDSAGSDTNYCYITGMIADPTDSSEASKIEFTTKYNNSYQTSLILSGYGDATIKGDIILNDGGSLKEAGGVAAFTFDGSGHVTKIGQDTPADGQALTWDNTNSRAVWTAVSASSLAADDITAGDAAVTLATTTGNITIDAQASDSDIILKGTDGGADTTFLTLDGSDAGTATFNHDIKLQSDAAKIYFGADDDVYFEHIADMGIKLVVNPDGSQDPRFILYADHTAASGPEFRFQHVGMDAANDIVGKIDFYGKDDSSAQRSSGDIKNVVADIGQASWKTNFVHNVYSAGSITTALELRGSATSGESIVDIKDHDGSASGLALSGTVVTATAAEINKLDGGTSATSTTLVDADRIIVNDNGTIVQVALSDLKTYTGSGGSQLPPEVKATTTSNFTVSLTPSNASTYNAIEVIYLVSNGSTAVTSTLPTAASIAGKKVNVKRLGTANVTVDGYGSETIDGATTFVLTSQYSSVTMVSNGTNWFII